MDDVYVAAGIKDRGGRRLGIDRRSFLIPSYCPETRSGQDRRGGSDRRKGKDDSLISFDPKRRTDRYIEWFRTVRGLFWGAYFGALLWGIMIIMFSTFIRAS